MQEYIEKIEKFKKSFESLIKEGNDLLPNEEYLSDQHRIDVSHTIFENIDFFISIFKNYYYKRVN